MNFNELGLAEPLLRAVSEEGYTVPTPIQAQAIPAVLTGKDLLAGAQTGTGKTAGFTLPMLHRLLQSPTPRNARGVTQIRALVMTPTRELAAQVHESIRTYGKHVPLKSAVMFGGVGMQPQIDALRRGLDILVATPGRLLDHHQQGTLDLSKVEIFVLDEADRMLDMGFIHDIKKVLAVLPKQKQSLLFSATFSDEIKDLADRLLNNPGLIEVARRNTTAETIAQKIHPVARDKKKELLAHLIKDNNWFQVLVFTRMKHGANRLAEFLNKNDITAMAIHGNKSQTARTKALAEFKAKQLQVLVATDIAARGIDIDQLPHVVNFELPNVPEDYVHRIGRTGRAGAEGEAISLVCVDEESFMRDIERLTKQTVKREIVPGFEPGAHEKPEPIVLGRQVLNPTGARGAPRGNGGGRGHSRSEGAGRSGAPRPAQHAPRTAQPASRPASRAGQPAPRSVQPATRQAPRTAQQAPRTAQQAPRTAQVQPMSRPAQPGSGAARRPDAVQAEPKFRKVY
jgi:ATP-dependent RNA helicase RhlE